MLLSAPRDLNCLFKPAKPLTCHDVVLHIKKNVLGTVIHHNARCMEYGVYQTKGSLKNNFTFYTPMNLLWAFNTLMHPVWLRCENSEYFDIPAFSRLARRAPQRLKL